MVGSICTMFIYFLNILLFLYYFIISLQPELVESVIIEDMGVRKFSKETVDIILAYISLLRESIDKAPPHDDEDEAKKFIAEYLKANVPPNLVCFYFSPSIF